VTLIVGGQQALNLALTVGEVSQTVEVTGAAPVVETTNATLSGEVVGTQIVELPLNGRDWVQLASLQPGVAEVRPHEAVDAPGARRAAGHPNDSERRQAPAERVQAQWRDRQRLLERGPGNVIGGNAGVDAIQEFQY